MLVPRENRSEEGNVSRVGGLEEGVVLPTSDKAWATAVGSGRLAMAEVVVEATILVGTRRMKAPRTGE